MPKWIKTALLGMYVSRHRKVILPRCSSGDIIKCSLAGIHVLDIRDYSRILFSGPRASISQFVDRREAAHSLAR
jgi:hypothetical protein